MVITNLNIKYCKNFNKFNISNCKKLYSKYIEDFYDNIHNLKEINISKCDYFSILLIFDNYELSSLLLDNIKNINISDSKLINIISYNKINMEDIINISNSPEFNEDTIIETSVLEIDNDDDDEHE